MKTSIAVRVGDTLAGQLVRTDDGARFDYAPDFLATCRVRGFGIGFSVPLLPSVETRGVNLHPFFAGLLPEGLRLTALQRAAKTSADDLFGLLSLAGRESIGDVVLDVHAPAPPSLDVNAIGHTSFAEVLQASLAYGEGGESRLLPGVQPKVSAAMVTLPVRVKRRPYQEALLKLEPEGIPLLVENEAFFMRLAQRTGLDVAKTHVVHDRDGRSGLLVERFDRLAEPPFRLHVEDACQFLARYPADKYRLHFSAVCEGVARFASAPAIEVAKAIRLLAFSYVIGNGDLHARNVSLLVSPKGLVTLAPAYDFLTTLPYGDRKLALTVEGRNDNLKRSHLLALAARFGVTLRSLQRDIDSLLDVVGLAIAEVASIGFATKKTKDLMRVMAKRRDDLR